jgi:hypothetical protein
VNSSLLQSLFAAIIIQKDKKCGFETSRFVKGWLARQIDIQFNWFF